MDKAFHIQEVGPDEWENCEMMEHIKLMQILAADGFIIGSHRNMQYCCAHVGVRHMLRYVTYRKLALGGQKLVKLLQNIKPHFESILATMHILINLCCVHVYIYTSLYVRACPSSYCTRTCMHIHTHTPWLNVFGYSQSVLALGLPPNQLISSNCCQCWQIIKYISKLHWPRCRFPLSRRDPPFPAIHLQYKNTLLYIGVCVYDTMHFPSWKPVTVIQHQWRSREIHQSLYITFSTAVIFAF